MGAFDAVVARLREERQRREMTQAETAERIGAVLGRDTVSVVTIAHYERGARRPSVDFLEAWAEVLGLEVVIDLRERA